LVRRADNAANGFPSSRNSFHRQDRDRYITDSIVTADSGAHFGLDTKFRVSVYSFSVFRRGTTGAEPAFHSNIHTFSRVLRGQDLTRRAKGGTAMAENSGQISMLADLIDLSLAGKKVDLKAKPLHDTVSVKQEDKVVDKVIISMEYSGAVEGRPFSFTKEYSHAEDDAQYALEALLIANNRLTIDFDRLKEARIDLERIYFTFQNTFLGPRGTPSARVPAVRLATFIQLARAGVRVSCSAEPRRPDIVLKKQGAEEKGFAYMVSFAFTTAEGRTAVEKLYGRALYSDPEKDQARTKVMANRRLERDCERLRNAGIQVGPLAF
jgi:hypothetical protein